MKDLFSPGSLLTVAGAVLTVIGSVAYATDSPNVSLPGSRCSCTKVSAP